MQTLYDVLGVPVSATQADVHNAYRRLLLRFHPDRCYHDNDSAIYNPSSDLDAARQEVLDKAHEILSNPEKRRLYNAYLTHKWRSHTALYQSSFPQQWYARTPADMSSTEDVFDSIMGMMSSSLVPPPAGSKPYLSSNTSSTARNQPSQQQQQQSPQQTSSMTRTLNTPIHEMPSSPETMPVVYTAAISMQRQPDGTVSVRSYKSGPRAINAPPTTATTATTSVPVTKTNLPRRVRVVEEQLNYKSGSPTSRDDAGDALSDAVSALTNSVFSLVAAATEA